MHELKSMLLAEMSRRNTDFIKDIVLANKVLLDELFRLILLNEEPISRRAIWVLDVASESEPGILLPYINDLIIALPGFGHDGLKRHTLRMLTRYDMNLKQFLPILNLCLQYMVSEKESIAVRYQAMHLLYKLSNVEQGLKNELVSVIELQMHSGSAGLKNQSLKMLRRLKKEMNKLERN